ncbi:hypothetical protein WJX82_005105 [Trebouxia sp. C0006]
MQLRVAPEEFDKVDDWKSEQSANTSAEAISTQDATTESMAAPYLTFTHALRACVITLKLVSLISNITDLAHVRLA